MSIMLITHDMGVVAERAQRVVVMYAGKVVEEASVEALFAQPAASVHAGADPLDPAGGSGGGAEGRGWSRSRGRCRACCIRRRAAGSRRGASS